MMRTRITIAVDVHILAEIDRLVRDGTYPNRGQAIETLLKERLGRSRLAREAAKLDRAEEQALAEEGCVGEGQWPKY
jgi:Arc/MetJ-type ribon-helix-helix transcriptional regulator